MMWAICRSHLQLIWLWRLGCTSKKYPSAPYGAHELRVHFRVKSLAHCLTAVAALAACGNPGGIGDEDYAEFKQLGAPKILYSCGDRVAYVAGVGAMSTYNKILGDAKEKCGAGEFKVLESKQ